MNIPDMHVWFRQYAQQMGLQNVRAILPDQIDLVINTSIIDTVNQIIRENISSSNDRIITDNSKLAQINSLRTLYRVKLLPMTGNQFMYFDASDRRTGKLSNIIKETGTEVNPNSIPDNLYLVDFSVNYKTATLGYSGSITGAYPVFSPTAVETNLFPVRLIDDMYLADTLNDFILKPRLRSPILVIYNNSTFDLYIEEFKLGVGNSWYLKNNLIPYQFRISYIAKPAKVHYDEDINGTNVDCDLPESLHVDILKHAVDLYRIAVSGSLHANQQRQQQPQQNNSNYRDGGEQQT